MAKKYTAKEVIYHRQMYCKLMSLGQPFDIAQNEGIEGIEKLQDYIQNLDEELEIKESVKDPDDSIEGLLKRASVKAEDNKRFNKA